MNCWYSIMPFTTNHIDIYDDFQFKLLQFHVPYVTVFAKKLTKLAYLLRLILTTAMYRLMFLSYMKLYNYINLPTDYLYFSQGFQPRASTAFSLLIGQLSVNQIFSRGGFLWALLVPNPPTEHVEIFLAGSQQVHKEHNFVITEVEGEELVQALQLH